MNKYILYRQASEFTGFHEKIGALIEPYLDERWTMVDVGCGMALLDFQVMGSVRSLTAIDTDEDALAEVEKRIDEELAANHSDAAKIETLHKNAFELEQERWDVVLMSFFADTPAEAGKMMSLAAQRSVIIMRGNEYGDVMDPIMPGMSGMSVEEMESYLASAGYGYRKNVIDLQFGQPFRTLDEIHEFIEDRTAAAGAAPATGDAAAGGDKGGAMSLDPDRLAYSVEDRIIKTKRYDYPYYLPRNLRTAIFIVATGD